MISLLVAILFIYGFVSNYFNVFPITLLNIPATSVLEYVLMGVLTVAGFGMLLNYFTRCTWTVIFNIIFIVLLNTILTPLFHKFWFNAITNGFGNES